MNELQLGLLALGGIAVLGVAAFNKWQEFRHRQLVERVLQRDHSDVLLDEPAAGLLAAAERMDAEAPAVARVEVSEVDDFSDFTHCATLAESGFSEPADSATEPGRYPDGKADGDADRSSDSNPGLHPVEDTAGLSSGSIRHRGMSYHERQEPQLYSDDADLPFPDLPEPVVSKPMAGVAAFASAPEPDEVPPAARGESQQAQTVQPGPSQAAAFAGSALATPAATGNPVPAAAPEPVSRINPVPAPVIDYVANFELVEAVSGDQILRSQRDVLARVSKPILWSGCNERSGQWELLCEEASYRSLSVSLLLADRRGPLGEADLLTFYGAMQNLADELMAVADMPPRESALDAAIALDQFCAHVDIQVGINVVSKGQSFLGTKIRALAEAAGMVLDSSGRFVRCDDDGHVLYTLANLESSGFSAEAMKTMSTHALVFVLDVPCVSHGDRIFAQMLDLARRMAEALNGVLVDDHRRPLTEAALDPFRRQIAQYQAQLAAKGLPAGSPMALRLFA